MRAERNQESDVCGSGGMMYLFLREIDTSVSVRGLWGCERGREIQMRNNCENKGKVTRNKDNNARSKASNV